MWLTRISIQRPVFITMVVAALVVLGWRARSRLNVELTPKVDIPIVTISVAYPGAGPQEIETLVTKPIEEAVASVSRIKTLSSFSQEGISVVILEFQIGTDLDVAVADVREKVDAVRGRLPRDVFPPVISKFDIASMPILFVGVTSSRLSLRELRDWVNNVLKDRISQVEGVASVTVTGGEVREVQVRLDKRRLEAYGLTVSAVAQALRAQNLNLPSGRVKEGRTEYSVRVLGEFQSVEEIRDLWLSFPNPEGGPPLRLRLVDLGEVVDASAERVEITRVNGRESIGLLIQKTSDANTVKVAEGVRREVARFQRAHPEVEFSFSQDASKMVLAALEDINVSLVLAIIIVVFVVFLFLHNLRGTFIVSLAIPTSLISTFLLMYFAGFTLNQMTMLALSLVVGILVDDSIVVLENIFRHLQRGEAPREAAFNGRTEIGLAAITITMTDVVVFVPIAFMGGIVGQFFREFGLTVATATLFSLFVSFTFTPMLAARWFRRGEELEARTGLFRSFDAFYHALDTGYRRLLAWALGHRFLTVAIGVLSLVAVLALAGPRLGFEFLSQVDQGRIGITVELPVGTRLEVTDQVARAIEEEVSRIPEVQTIFTNVGSISGSIRGGFLRGSSYAQIMLDLVDKESTEERFLPFLRKGKRRTRSDQEIAAEIRHRLASLPGATIVVAPVSMMGRGSTAPIQIELLGENLEDLLTVANEIRGRLERVPGVLNPDISWRMGKPELQVRIDRVKVAEMGLSVAQIAALLRDALEGNTEAKYRERGWEYDIRVQLREEDRRRLDEVGKLLIGTRNRQPIYLEQVAQVQMGSGPTEITRKNRQRLITVTAKLAPGYPLGNVQREIRKAIADVDLRSTTLNWGGEFEIMQESFGHLLEALLLSLILVYMLMAALFENYLHPFTIMLSQPMALIGALLALVLTGNTLSIISMIGIIMLVGLVTKNAILLIDYTNTLRRRSLGCREAILEAGPTRLRPVLMTTVAMILGMLPIALKIGRASEIRAPMAIAVIGGLLLSTLLTLLVIPVVYSLFDDVGQWLRRLWQGNNAR